MNVLVIDDSPTNLTLMGQLVRSVGANPLTFADPVRALAEAPQIGVDLCVVDYNMPGLDGLQVVGSLRKDAWSIDIPIVMITASEEAAVRHSALELGATDFLRRPIDAVEVKSRLRNLLKLRQAQKQLKDRAACLTAEVEAATRIIAEREEEIILRLARAGEFRDTDTGAHVVRVARYSMVIAQDLGLDRELCRLIYLATPMHDVGKIGVRDTVLLKPGRLTAEERVEIEKHSAFGEEILSGSNSRLIQIAREIAGSHHERWDGSGYPRGLQGTEIPISGRIAAVADVFDALTSERPYKPAWSLEKARGAIVDGSGSQFDPDCVAAFLRCWNAILAVRGETADTLASVDAPSAGWEAA
jgi:putative two-component system response regulator